MGLVWEAVRRVARYWEPRRFRGQRLRSYLATWAPLAFDRCWSPGRWEMVSLEELPVSARELSVWPRAGVELDRDVVRRAVGAIGRRESLAAWAGAERGRQTELAEELGVTRARVGQLRDAAWERLRTHRTLEDLAAGGLEPQSGPFDLLA